MIRHRIQVRSPEIDESALAQPEVVRQPFRPPRRRLPDDFVRRQVDYQRDLDGVQRVCPAQDVAENVRLQEERFLYRKALGVLARLGQDPELLDGSPVPHVPMIARLAEDAQVPRPQSPFWSRIFIKLRLRFCSIRKPAV